VAQESVGFGAVGDTAGRAIVINLLADAVSDEAEEHHFDHVAGVPKVARRFEATLAGVEPFLLETAFHRRQQFGFGSGFVIGEVGLIAARHEKTVLKIGDEAAARAFEEDAVANLVEIDCRMRGVRQSAALIPGDFDFRTPIVGGEIKVRLEFHGDNFGVEGIAHAFGGSREFGVDGVPGEVHRVAAHIADLPGAPVPMHVPMEAAAFEIFRVVRMEGRGTEPQIVIDVAGRIAFGGHVVGARNPAITKCTDFLKFANCAVANELADAVEVGELMALCADLSGELVFGLEPLCANEARFFDAIDEGFFAIDVFAAIHGPIRDERVGVVERATDDRVDILLIKALAPIFIRFCLGK